MPFDAKSFTVTEVVGPIVLNVRDVALAAKKAFDEGRLSAQGPTPACKYRDDSGRPCAIGAALSADEIDRLLHGAEAEMETPIAGLAPHFRTDRLDALTELQDAHDEWCHTRGGSGPSTPKAAKRDFVRVLSRLLADPAHNPTPEAG